MASANMPHTMARSCYGMTTIYLPCAVTFWIMQFAFTDDFAYFDFSAEALRERFPEAGILRVKGFRTEDPSLPVNPDIIR